jgi:hypothetical protein
MQTSQLKLAKHHKNKSVTWGDQSPETNILNSKQRLIATVKHKHHS